MILIHRRGIAAGLVATLSFALPALAQPVTPAPGADTAALIDVYKTTIAPVFTGDQTIIGQTIAYPAGVSKVKSPEPESPPVQKMSFVASSISICCVSCRVPQL